MHASTGNISSNISTGYVRANTRTSTVSHFANDTQNAFKMKVSARNMNGTQDDLSLIMIEKKQRLHKYIQAIAPLPLSQGNNKYQKIL